METPASVPMTALLRRRILEDPECYPCWSGVSILSPHFSAPQFTPRAGCAERCCINPPITPEGEDTPKWAEKMAAEEEAARVEETSIGRQPEFPQTPDKTVFTHNVESGNTPAGATNYESFRVENKHYGQPGLSVEDPVHLVKPSRDKK